MKKDLLALYIKHDSNFKTISKIALGELILKIIYYAPKSGATLAYVSAELDKVCSGKISNSDIEDAIAKLKGKIQHNVTKYVLSNEFKKTISEAIEESEKLHTDVVRKYFGDAESAYNNILEWFKDLTISFFEKYNFEWFHLIGKNGKRDTSIFQIEELIVESLNTNNAIKDNDKEWLHRQYLKFINESDINSDKLFLQYGLSSFSARLISASNFANKINIDVIKNTTYLLDTNVLMILHLESHNLSDSIKILEDILSKLDINMEYLYYTKEEYRRAIFHKKKELKEIFEEYDINVLYATDCPFVRTALHRKCQKPEDIDILFGQLEVIPEKFNSKIDICILEDKELNEIIDKEDNKIQDKINTIYKRLRCRDKREAALIHDAKLIKAADYLRNNSKKYTILTNDTVLKRYSVENSIRDEQGIAIGIDALIGILSVSSGGININPTDFAPLFKNIINSSLMPNTESFTPEDLIFILETHLNINKLPSNKVIEIAQKVNKQLSANESSEDVGLYLRRELERDRISQNQEVEHLKNEKDIILQQRNDFQEQNKTFITNYCVTRKKALMSKYGRKITIGIIVIIGVFLGIVLLEYLSFTLKTWWWTIAATIFTGICAGFIFNKVMLKKKTSYEKSVDMKILTEVEEMSKND